MLKTIKVKLEQGQQTIPDIRKAKPLGFRGLPQISPASCESACAVCQEVCPTAAISLNPVRIDLAKCVFCSECTRVCPIDKIRFTEGYRMASSSLEGLVVGEGTDSVRVEVSRIIQKRFGRSLKLRSVSSGGCNACEMELGALGNVNFDMGRFGIEFVASPRHADALVISGPLTANMSRALALAYEGIPDPKFVIGIGACTLSGGLYAQSTALERGFLERFRPALYVPGCPPHPLTLLNGILDLIGQS